MESMRDIRTRKASVQKTMKITKAMYLMSSAKLKRPAPGWMRRYRTS